MVGGAAAALVGCGDDGGSQVPDEKVLSTLSDAEEGSVCDYLAQQYGGYGKAVTCPDREPRSVWSNQAACKAALGDLLQDCAATFGQLKACTAKSVAAGCDSSAAENSAECKEFDEAC
jgi:hypothetical protein